MRRWLMQCVVCGSLTLALGLLIAACQTPATNPDRWHGAFMTRSGPIQGRLEVFDADLKRAIPDPEATTLIVFNHGTAYDGINQKCDPVGSTPPLLQALLDHYEVSVIYYFCSEVTSFGTRVGRSGQNWYLRGQEIEQLLDKLIAYGVPPKQIFLAGHSGGASATLAVAARAPDKFNAFIASAPGYGYAHTGLSAQNPRLSKFYSLWKDYLTAVDRLDGMVFGYDGDTISPVAEMAFLADRPGVTFVDVPMSVCSYAHPHADFYLPCFENLYYGLIKTYLRERTGEAISG